ncbi:hypothetical protein HanIR_Chr01g0030771 [Helianthus annuus]|nr:hypothetical protein HanIR_Chr01g0030771 [Helianthus annuus]
MPIRNIPNPLDLSTVSFPKFLHLMPALNRCFRWVTHRTPSGVLPVVGGRAWVQKMVNLRYPWWLLRWFVTVVGGGGMMKKGG